MNRHEPRTPTTATQASATSVAVGPSSELGPASYQVLRAGASGFLLKDAEPASLVDAVRRTHAGESLFAPALLARIVGRYLDGGPQRGAVAPQLLTSREVEVLALVGRGLSNQEIGQRLTISMGTVKTHIGNLLAKLVARDRAQLVIAAFDHGLVTAERPSPGSRPGPA